VGVKLVEVRGRAARVGQPQEYLASADPSSVTVTVTVTAVRTCAELRNLALRDCYRMLQANTGSEVR
jgi:hypothetical protein